MASLTHTAILARKIIRYSLYVVILLIIGRILFGLGVGLFRIIFPPPAPEPEVCFGKLPGLPFPQSVNSSGITYTLQTPEGKLPELNEQVVIYFMPKAISTQTALDTAIDKARRLGFDTTGTQLPNVETVYVFDHPSEPARLKINIVTGTFSISYDVSSDPSVIIDTPPAPEAAIAQARTILSRAGLLQDDLSGPATHEFLRYQGNHTNEVLSLSEADLTKVNIFRKAYSEQELPAVTAKSDEANVWFALSGSRNKGKEIILGEYHYFPIDEENSCTYPVKTAQQAWEDLQNGRGFIAEGSNLETATIRRVYLAYYDAGQYSEFYQPVVVFEDSNTEGDITFRAYVPAITDGYYGNQPSSN
jgi:hypothetical protein